MALKGRGKTNSSTPVKRATVQEQHHLTGTLRKEILTRVPVVVCFFTRTWLNPIRPTENSLSFWHNLRNEISLGIISYKPDKMTPSFLRVRNEQYNIFYPCSTNIYLYDCHCNERYGRDYPLIILVIASRLIRLAFLNLENIMRRHTNQF